MHCHSQLPASRTRQQVADRSPWLAGEQRQRASAQSGGCQQRYEIPVESNCRVWPSGLRASVTAIEMLPPMPNNAISSSPKATVRCVSGMRMTSAAITGYSKFMPLIVPSSRVRVSNLLATHVNTNPDIYQADQGRPNAGYGTVEIAPLRDRLRNGIHGSALWVKFSDRARFSRHHRGSLAIAPRSPCARDSRSPRPSSRR